MKDILKTVFVLALLATISGALLGFVNDITYVSLDEEMERNLLKIYDNPSELSSISPSSDSSNQVDLSHLGKVEDAFVSPDGIYILRVSGKGGYGGNVELLYSIKDYKILKIVPFSHSETPGLGTKGFEEDYLEQYYALDLQNVDMLELVKNKEPEATEVVVITSATYTSNAIINASNVAINWYNNNAQIFSN